jgi:pimeloyl-ACP methyl ester carboxylesterase
MEAASQTLPVRRGPYRLHAEIVPGTGVPVVLMHGFPDNTHLYDRLLPYLVGRRPVARFDFLGWGRSDKPAGYPYTADSQVGDVTAVTDAVAERLGTSQLTLVAHDASGPPAIDWALAHPDRVAALVLLNTYYQWTPSLRRRPRSLCTPRRWYARSPAQSLGGCRTWTGACTPGRSACSSKIPSSVHSWSRRCMSSSCPPGRRSGASTTT